MALSQPATFNESWSDERVASYMNHLPPQGESEDFHILYHAYKHMRPHDFERLLKLFTEAGKNVSASNKEGKTLVELIQPFEQHSKAFTELLNKYA